MLSSNRKKRKFKNKKQGKKLMFYVIFLILSLFLSSCTLFNKSQSNPDDLIQVADEVLKKGEGVDIQIEPIPEKRPSWPRSFWDTK